MTAQIRTSRSQHLGHIHRTKVRRLSRVFHERGAALHDTRVVDTMLDTEAVAEFVARGAAHATEPEAG